MQPSQNRARFATIFKYYAKLPEVARFIPTQNVEESAVVANLSMNRSRGLFGANAYAKDLHLEPLEFLDAQLGTQDQVAWLDLCCGEGRALSEAAQYYHDRGLEDRVQLVGVDLVGQFVEHAPRLRNLTLEVQSASNWSAARKFELITCVHRLHYIGDKLSLIRRAAEWLTPGGLFVANLDLQNFKFSTGAPAGQQILGSLKQCGFSYQSRRRLLARIGPVRCNLPYRFLGADDQAGPNYTGQPAVDSYYAPDERA